MADSKSRNISNLPIAIPDVPDAVTISSATDVGTSRAYNNGAATVTFSQGTGGLPSSYAVTTTPSTTTTTATSSPATIVGLSSATSYTATVRPVNVSATGPAATSSSFTATTVPQAPTIGTFTDGGTGTTGTLSFTANATGGSTITNYKTSTDNVTFTALSPAQTSSPLSLTGLTVGTATYYIKAVNANGDSSASSGVSGTVIQPSAFESIASATPTGGSVVFSSIPQTYTSLQIRILARASNSVTTKGIIVWFNSSRSSYTDKRLRGNGTAASASGSGTGNGQIYLDDFPGSSALSSTFGVGVIDLHDYTSTTRNKTLRASYGYDLNGSGEMILKSGLWVNTAAITSVTVSWQNEDGNFVSGSTVALYGIKG